MTLTIEFLNGYKDKLNVKTACVLSPSTEFEYYNNIFDNVVSYTKQEWDLNNQIESKFDIIIAHNIFYMAKNPNIWIDNVMNSCRYFLLQDLLKRKRDINTEFCKFDEDNTRFSFNNHKYYDGETFNLSNIKYKIVNGLIYNGEPNKFDNNPIHFVCLIENIIQ